MKNTLQGSNRHPRSNQALRLCSGLLLAASTVPTTAFADCVSPPRGGDDALFARVSQVTIDEHQRLYDGQIYKMLADFGWDAPDRGEEFTSHFFATLLINHGIESPNPPVRQNPATGLFEYDAEAITLSRTFHRSWDGYAPLAFDTHATSCQDVNPHTGERFCNPARRYLFSSSIENFGHETGTGVIDLIGGVPCLPGQTCTLAQHAPIWDLFKDPDWLQEYSCFIWDSAFGVTTTASTIIHENWHGVGPNHSGGGGTNCTSGSCDTFVWDATTSERMFGGLSHQQTEGVGSFQAADEFLCDLTESPADWIPLQTQAVIQAEFQRMAAQSRFMNDDVPLGQLPLLCGEPSAFFKVADDGAVSCASGATCQSDADCNDFVAATADTCGPTSCCEFTPLCADGDSCTADADCDDAEPVTFDSCGTNRCCLHERIN
jgi:hypothetical protein